MYVVAAAHDREDKLATAATNMGVTVVAGGVTTLGSAIFMYFCQLTFFSKMATLITGTIAFSLVYSLLFFMPLCAVFGPEGDILKLREQVSVLLRGRQPRQGGRAQPDAPGRAEGAPKEVEMGANGSNGVGGGDVVTTSAV